ncbi:hypothetical protein EV122DRAFT_280382 [Schizophyllum commune]
MQLDSRIFSSPPTDSLRRRLEPYNLPENAVNDAINAYLASASELRQLVVDAYTEMDTDEEREQLIGHYECHLETFADKVMEAVQDWESANPSRSTLEPIHTLPRDKRPLLEAYFLLNAHPDPKAKKALAEYEGITYRQVHTWFQNRRRRMKGFLPAYDAAVDVDELYERTFGAPVLREDESPSPASCASQQDGTYQEERPGLARAEPLEKYTCQDWRVAYEQAPTATSHYPEEFMGEASDPLSLQSPVASKAHDDQPRRTTVLRSAADRRRAKRHAPYVKDVTASLGAMNRSHNIRRASRSSSFLRLCKDSIYFQLCRRQRVSAAYTSDWSSQEEIDADEQHIKRVFVRTIAQLEFARVLFRLLSSLSILIPSVVAGASRITALVHFSHAKGYALGPASALPARDEDRSLLHRDDDPGAFADFASSMTSPATMPAGLQGPDEGQRHPSTITLPGGHPDYALFSIDTKFDLPCPASSDVLQTASDDTAALTDLFGPYTTAKQEHGLIIFPNLDETTIPDLNVDSHTLNGPLDIRVATWDASADLPPFASDRSISDPLNSADTSSSIPSATIPTATSQCVSSQQSPYDATVDSFFTVGGQNGAFPSDFGYHYDASLYHTAFGAPLESPFSFGAGGQVSFSFGPSLIAA